MGEGTFLPLRHEDFKEKERSRGTLTASEILLGETLGKMLVPFVGTPVCCGPELKPPSLNLPCGPCKQGMFLHVNQPLPVKGLGG